MIILADFFQQLKKAMNIRNVSQSELCEKTGIPKSAMSQYISGSFKPKQERTYLIAKALNVNEAWLMGFETIPMEKNIKSNSIDIPTHFKISSHEKELVVAYREHPESQPVIDKILDIDKPKTIKVMTAARSEDGQTPIEEIEMTQEEVDELFNAPETDDDF